VIDFVWANRMPEEGIGCVESHLATDCLDSIANVLGPHGLREEFPDVLVVENNLLRDGSL
jgi:hypothetical protein